MLALVISWHCSDIPASETVQIAEFRRVPIEVFVSGISPLSWCQCSEGPSSHVHGMGGGGGGGGAGESGGRDEGGGGDLAVTWFVVLWSLPVCI